MLITQLKKLEISINEIKKCLKTLVGYTDYVRSVGCSPDGQIIIPSGDDKSIKIWDVKTNQYLIRWLDTMIGFIVYAIYQIISRLYLE